MAHRYIMHTCLSSHAYMSIKSCIHVYQVMHTCLSSHAYMSIESCIHVYRVMHTCLSSHACALTQPYRYNSASSQHHSFYHSSIRLQQRAFIIRYHISHRNTHIFILDIYIHIDIHIRSTIHSIHSHYTTCLITVPSPLPMYSSPFALDMIPQPDRTPSWKLPTYSVPSTLRNIPL